VLLGGGCLVKPTKEDADLFLKLLAIMTSDEDLKKAMIWFQEEFEEMSYEAFKKKYPHGSEGNRNFNRYIGNWEVIGTLVANGLLSEDLVFDMFMVPWKKAKPIVHGMRKDIKEPRLYENFEALSEKLVAWEKKHPPKFQ